MEVEIDLIRSELRQSGWSAVGAVLPVLGGGSIYMVSCRKRQECFFVRGESPLEAWGIARRAALQQSVQPSERAPVVKFPSRPRQTVRAS